MRIPHLPDRPRGTSWSVLAVIVLGALAMPSPVFASGTTSTSTFRAPLSTGGPPDRVAVRPN